LTFDFGSSSVALKKSILNTQWFKIETLTFELPATICPQCVTRILKQREKLKGKKWIYIQLKSRFSLLSVILISLHTKLMHLA
jgi:hypothetical protein